jgi:DNA mismatch repair protein MutS2
VINASVEFDLESLRPTFHLTVGLPGRSNALAIASRLGLPDEIIKEARKTLNPTDLKVDDLLDDIHRQRRLADKARQAAEGAREDAENLRVQLADRLEAFEEEKYQELKESRREARIRLDELEGELKKIKKDLATKEGTEKGISDLEQSVAEVSERIVPPSPPSKKRFDLPQPRGPIQEGDLVYLRSLGKKGSVISVNGDDVEVQVGNIRVRAGKSDLEFSSESEKSQEEIGAEAVVRTHQEVKSPGTELDLRGQQVDEALQNLEFFLDKAYLARLPWVRIIHGMGTGKLRAAVRNKLKQHPQVDSFEAGKENEGGDGATVVSFQE